MSTLRIIGLHSPHPQSGKSTVAQALAAREGGVVVSIADGIREMARSLGLHAAADALGAEKDRPSLDLGGRTPRQVLIAVGNAMRAKHGEGYWLDQLMEKIGALPKDTQLVVIDDIRTQLEGEAVFGKGGVVVTITRSDARANPNDVGGFQSVISVENEGAIDECVEAVWQAALSFDLAEAA